MSGDNKENQVDSPMLNRMQEVALIGKERHSSFGHEFMSDKRDLKIFQVTPVNYDDIHNANMAIRKEDEENMSNRALIHRPIRIIPVQDEVNNSEIIKILQQKDEKGSSRNSKVTNVNFSFYL